MRETPESRVALHTGLASALELDGPDAPPGPGGCRCLYTTESEIADALARLAGLQVPGTAQAVEALSALVLSLHHSALLNRSGPVYILGGTHETGPPIDPETRLLDCAIAAADLGMFAPLPKLDPEVEQQWPPGRKSPAGIVWRGYDPGKQASALRRAEHARGLGRPADRPLSIHEQFRLDWDCLIGATVDILVERLEADGQIDTNVR